jgi:hypothetical protein
LYRCETWSLILGEEYTLRIFGDGVLRKISGPKVDEKRKCWKKTDVVKLNIFLLLAKYYYEGQIKKDVMGVGM